VYFLTARIRNSKAVGEVLRSKPYGLSLLSKITANFGHDGLPVFSALCEPGDVACKAAEVVCTLSQQRRVPLQSMVLMLFRPLLPSLDYAKVIMGFYKALGTRYMDNKRRQQQSLIPLPLLALDIQSHSTQDLQNALKMVETWIGDLRQFFINLKVIEMEDSEKMWKDAAETLFRDLDKSSPSSRSPASEKVRSILLHLLMKCRGDAASKTREGEQVTGERRNTSQSVDCTYSKLHIFKNFEMRWQELLGSGKKATMQCGGEASTNKRALCSSTSKKVPDEEALGRLLNKKSFRFLQIMNFNEVQGCEFDAVVGCGLPGEKNHMHAYFSHCLSRAKLLAILIARKSNWEEYIGPNFSHHIRDWSEFEQISI
jgi:hypothetical protein